MKEREKLKLTVEDARLLITEDLEGYEVIKDEITDNSRWSVNHEITFKRISDGKYFQGHYSRGATEMQDESPFEYSDSEFEEVFPVEKIIIVYE